MSSHVVPILNTNDAIVYPQPVHDDFEINIADNDCLAAKLASMLHTDLVIMMSDVKGVYNRAPSQSGAYLLSKLNPFRDLGSVNFGDKSNLGTGGMQSKIGSAAYALRHDSSVVICSGKQPNAIVDILAGKKVGTLLTNEISSLTTEHTAINGIIFIYAFFKNKERRILI